MGREIRKKCTKGQLLLSYPSKKKLWKGTEIEGEIQRKFKEVAPVSLSPAFATY